MNHYEVLGISKDASKDQIKQAYRKLALQFHPDMHVHSPKNIRDTATSKFKKANEAYETLINDRTRASYDYTHRSANSSHQNYGSNSYKSDYSSSNQSSHQRYGSDSYKSDYYRRDNYNYGGSKSKKSQGFGFEFRPGMGIRGFRLRIGYGLMWDLVGTVASIWVMKTIGEKLKEFNEKLDKKLKESEERIEDKKKKSKEKI